MRRLLLLGFVFTAMLAWAEWRPVKSWAGTGMKQTESFEIASREWRIT
jgi:hypothetical protein